MSDVLLWSDFDDGPMLDDPQAVAVLTVILSEVSCEAISGQAIPLHPGNSAAVAPLHRF